MGTAFSRGSSDHISPLRLENSLFDTDTQADTLRQELVIEEVDDDEAIWERGIEEGLVQVGLPEKGKMTKIKIVGQAVFFVNSNGKIVIEN